MMDVVTPKLTVDAVIVEGDKVVLIRRVNPPFKGMWALPGGFVEVGETVEEACVREAGEETSLDVGIVKLVGVYSDPKRDPRGHTVGVIFLCKVKGGRLKAADDAGEAGWFSLGELPELAFDHGRILGDVKTILKKQRIL